MKIGSEFGTKFHYKHPEQDCATSFSIIDCCPVFLQRKTEGKYVDITRVNMAVTEVTSVLISMFRKVSEGEEMLTVQTCLYLHDRNKTR